MQHAQLVAVPQPGRATGSGGGVMTSGGGALQPLMYWYPAAGGQVSPVTPVNASGYLMPTCTATRGLAQVSDMLSC